MYYDGDEIFSPNYPSNYPPGIDCRYIIKMEKIVSLHFLEFNLPGVRDISC